MEAQSGLGQGSARLRLRYRQGLGYTGLRQGSGTGCSVLPGTTPAVAVGGDGDWKAQRRVGGSDWDSVVVCTTPAVAGTAEA